MAQEENYQNDSSNLLHNKMNSTFASNEGNNYNYRTNQDKYYLNNIGLSNNSLSNFRKINNLYEDNYNQKYINTTYKSDFSRNGLLKDDDNIRNSKLNKPLNFQNAKPIQKLSNTNHYYNNTLYNMNNNQFRKISKKEIFTERSHNKDYRYKNIINPNLKNASASINELRMNDRQNMYNNIKDDKYIENENENSKINRNIHSKSNNNNKSMDSKIINNNNHEKHIINVNKGKIINLSNLNDNFSYTSEKYTCFYVNKREKNIKLKQAGNYQEVKLNLSKYYVNKRINKDKDKEEKEEKPEPYNDNITENKPKSKISNSKTTYFTHKKKDMNKYPLRINFTEENVTNALSEKEPIEDIKKEKEKEIEKNDNNKKIDIKDYSSQNNNKNVAKINFHHSFKDNNHKKINQTNQNSEKKQIITPYINTQRIKMNETKKNNEKNISKDNKDDEIRNIQINDLKKNKEQNINKENEKKIKNNEENKNKKIKIDDSKKIKIQDINKKILINIQDNNNRNIRITEPRINKEQNTNKENNKKIKNNKEDNNIRNIKINDSNTYKNKEQNNNKDNKEKQIPKNNNINIKIIDSNKNKEPNINNENYNRVINTQENNNIRNIQINDLKKNQAKNINKENDKKLINKQENNIKVNEIKKNKEEQKNNNENDNNMINTNQENKNTRSIGIGNTNERNEIKISNNIGNKNKIEYTFNHNQLVINSNKHNKKKNILKIKSNDKITINNKLNNNSNTSNINNNNKEEKRVYKISSNVVNEQYYKDKFIEKEIDSEDEDYLTISMQSLNDSNIMEIANRYITEEEGLDKNEVNEILNCKKDRLI